MPTRRTRVALFVLDTFVALSAIGGGLAIVASLDRFPPEWLRGSPFGDYVIPGLILASIVGGSTGAAAAIVWRRPRLGISASAAAGLVLAAWIVGEVIILNQNGAPTSPRSPTEALYLIVGVAMTLPRIAALFARERTPAA